MTHITNFNRAIFYDLIDQDGAIFNGEGFKFKVYPRFPELRPIDPEAESTARARGELPQLESLENGWAMCVARVPKAIKLEKSKKKLPDFHRVLCSDPARDLIEAYEPGRHQFFHVNVLSPAGRKIGETNFLNICTRLDAIDIDKTKLGHRSRSDEVPKRFDSPHNVKEAREWLFLEKSIIDGHHIWRDARIRHYFVSDEFFAEVKARGLTGLTTFKVGDSE